MRLGIRDYVKFQTLTNNLLFIVLNDYTKINEKEMHEERNETTDPV